MRPRRRSSRRFSSSCERPLIMAAPKSPDRPFSVWTARNTSLTSSASVPPRRLTSSSARRSRLRPSTISCASEKNSSRALSPALSPRPPPPCSAIASRTVEELLASSAEHLGRERFWDERVRAELFSTLDVALRRLRRDDDERRRFVLLGLTYEVDQLEPVHVGHVDIRDDQVVARPRQKPHRVET